MAFCGAAALVLGAATVASADVKVRKRMTVSGGGASALEMVEYVKGNRVRTESNFGGLVMVTLQQCDLNRVVQINEATKRYFVMPVGAAAAPAANPATAATKRGGVITITTTLVDTGERKQIHSMTARRIKTTIVQEPGPGACDTTASRVETDGWYVDLDGYGDACTTAATGTGFGGAAGGCVDEIRMKTVGTAKLGYPVTFTVNVGGPGASTFEVVEVSKAALDAALFEIPAGYTQVDSYTALMGAP
jgi:hypothetical protein